MKIAIKITLLLVIVVVCVVLVSMIINRPQLSNKEAVTELIQPEVTTDTRGSSLLTASPKQDSWPMFRGGQQLLGRATTRTRNNS